MTATWNFIKTKQQSLGQPAHLGCKIAILDILTTELRKIRGAVFVLKTWVKRSVHQKKEKRKKWLTSSGIQQCRYFMSAFKTCFVKAPGMTHKLGRDTNYEANKPLACATLPALNCYIFQYWCSLCIEGVMANHTLDRIECIWFRNYSHYITLHLSVTQSKK